jgi:peptidyl-prolyl cis-trans isomerase SurA
MKLFITVLIIIAAAGSVSCSTVFKTGASYEGEAVPPRPEWERYDRVIAVVNNSAIIESEMNRRLNQVLRQKNLSGKALVNERNSVIDTLINEALIEQIAEAESILVSREKVDNEIAQVMKRQGFSDLDKFRVSVEQKHKMSWEMFREEIRRQILIELVMSIAVDYAPPSKQDAEAWYKANRNKPDLIQVYTKHILIVPKSASFADEKAANQKIDEIRAKIMAGESFESLARKHSQDPGSAAKGGDIGWMALMQLDPMYANQAYQMNSAGSISPVFKSSFGYHIIKYQGRRVTPFEEIEPMIYGMLSQQGRGEQFKKWIQNKRQYSTIKVHLNDYTPTKL